jgi:AcrR family transcriptional regulator
MPRRRPTKRRAARRTAGSAAVRSQILIGASQAFGAKGLAGASVEDVLQAAGVSRRTFYKLFPNKEAVFEELAEAAGMIFLQSIKNAAALGKSPADKLANGIEVYLRAPQTAGPIFRVLQLEAGRPGSPHAARRAAIIDALVDMLATGIEEATGRPADRLVVRGVIGAVEAISLHVHETAPDDDEVIDRAKASAMAIAAGAFAP